MIFDKLKPISAAIIIAFLGLNISSQSLPLIENAPFKLETGRSFAASGRSETKRANAFNSRPKQIISDIEEAMTIIGQNSIVVKSNDKTAETVDGMLKTLDPHSHYYDQSEWNELLDDYNNAFVGVGVSIISRWHNNSIGTYVVSTVPGSPAAQSKLNYGDEIIRVGTVDTSGKNSAEVSSLIRGQNGTSVKLTLKDAADNKIKTVKLPRVKLPQPTVSAAFMIDKNVGYIGLTHGFSFTTANEVMSATTKLTALGMTSLILDIRGNPGGILEQSVRVAEQFLPSGTTIVSQRGRTPSDTRVWRSGNTPKLTIPLILLVDGETASASEVLAGAMQDNDRALIIGQRTFGKGLVQNVIDLPEQAGLTLTAAQYYTPSGRSIQRDYSDGSLYNYYNHKNQIIDIDKPLYAAKTVTERRVYGGNGIEPDITLDSKSPNTKLNDVVAFFVSSNMSLNNDNEELFSKFTDFAKLNSITELKKEQVLPLLRIELALAANGAAAGIHERIMYDETIHTAIKNMESSRELYAKASQLLSSNVSRNKKAR